jgi:hypothetical protein
MDKKRKISPYPYWDKKAKILPYRDKKAKKISLTGQK